MLDDQDIAADLAPRSPRRGHDHIGRASGAGALRANTCSQARSACMALHCTQEGRGRNCLSYRTDEYDRCMQTGEFRGRQCGLKTGLARK
jgi:hypothetical protein